LEKVCDAVPNYDMKTVLGDLALKLEMNPVYIQHVVGTALTMKQMLMENKW
jgi:hypothetical protein